MMEAAVAVVLALIAVNAWGFLAAKLATWGMDA